MDRISGSTAAPNMFGAGKNGFTSSNPVSQTPATVVSASWLNGIQEALMTVIESAGLVGNAADNSLLLNAIFAVVRQMGLHSGAASTLTVSGNINASSAGQTLLLQAAAGQTALLPGVSAVKPGDRFEFINVGTAAWSVVASGTDSIVVNGSGSTSSISVANGDTLTLVNSGSAWIAVGGSVQMSTSATFAWQARGGVNYQELPNGLILNFGNVSYISAASNVTVTFPCAYISNPIATVTGNPYASDSTAPILVTGAQWVDKTKIIIRNNGTNAASGVSWFAIGR